MVNDIYRVLRVAAVTMLLASAVVFAVGEEVVVQILKLARSGRNVDAISLYEKQSDQVSLPLDILRAVAGCYWREGRFDEARQLYRDILERQGLAGVEEAGRGVALLAKETSVASQTTTDEEKGSGGDALLTVMGPELQDSTDPDEKALLEEEKSRLESVLEVRDALQDQIGKFNHLVASLEAELESARDQYGALQDESQQKVNVLLDAVAEERRRRQAVEADFQKTAESLARRLQGTTSELQVAAQERDELLARLAVMEHEASGTVEVSQSREAAFLGQIELLRVENSASSLRIKGLEQSLLEIQNQLDEATVRLTLSELASTNQLVSATQNKMLLALDEIDRLESEYAELTVLGEKRLAALQLQIDDLESRGSSTALLLENTIRERDQESEDRQSLEARFALQTDTLNQAKLQLDEATAALNRQYDAMREQIQGDVTIRIDDLEAEDEKALWSADLEPDIASLIQRLESATQSAMAEVMILRRQLEQERNAFELAAEDSKTLRSELTLETEQLHERLELTLAAHKEETTRMQSVYEQEISELRAEMDDLRKALYARSEAVDLLERDLEEERESTMRLLSMAQESESQSSSIIQELERKILGTQSWEYEQAGDEAVSLDASVQAILDMLPSDPSGAMARFEALPATHTFSLDFFRSMGNAYLEQRRFKEALKIYEHIIEQVPSDLHAERKLVMTLFDMGKYDQALERLAGSSGAIRPE